MEASQLLMLSDAVRKACKEADGVIVTHGTDTLAFTAAYLGYLFSDSVKPIVLVSSRAPVGEPDANGVDNLAAAVALIEDETAHRGAFVSYRNLGEHTEILRATRTLIQPAFSDAVSSLGEPYAIYDGNRIMKNDAYRALPDGAVTGSVTDLSRRVFHLSPSVGVAYPRSLDGCDAVLLQSYHSGTLPTASGEFLDFLALARSCDRPIFVSGVCSDLQYESMDVYTKLGIKVLPAIAPVAAYMKLWISINRPSFSHDFLMRSVGEDIVS